MDRVETILKKATDLLASGQEFDGIIKSLNECLENKNVLTDTRQNDSVYKFFVAALTRIEEEAERLHRLESIDMVDMETLMQCKAKLNELCDFSVESCDCQKTAEAADDDVDEEGGAVPLEDCELHQRLKNLNAELQRRWEIFCVNINLGQLEEIEIELKSTRVKWLVVHHLLQWLLKRAEWLGNKRSVKQVTSSCLSLHIALEKWIKARSEANDFEEHKEDMISWFGCFKLADVMEQVANIGALDIRSKARSELVKTFRGNSRQLFSKFRQQHIEYLKKEQTQSAEKQDKLIEVGLSYVGINLIANDSDQLDTVQLHETVKKCFIFTFWYLGRKSTQFEVELTAAEDQFLRIAAVELKKLADNANLAVYHKDANVLSSKITKRFLCHHKLKKPTETQLTVECIMTTLDLLLADSKFFDARSKDLRRLLQKLKSELLARIDGFLADENTKNEKDSANRYLTALVKLRKLVQVVPFDAPFLLRFLSQIDQKIDTFKELTKSNQ